AERGGREAEVVRGPPLVRFGIGAWGAPGRGANALCRVLNPPPPQVPQAHGVVSTAVPRIAAQRLGPVRVRASGGVPVLFEVHTSDVKLVAAWNLLGQGRLGCRRGDTLPGSQP